MSDFYIAPSYQLKGIRRGSTGYLVLGIFRQVYVLVLLKPVPINDNLSLSYQIYVDGSFANGRA